jgi:DNA helicase II / ATP-dependent DNA helicase PcrA
LTRFCAVCGVVTTSLDDLNEPQRDGVLHTTGPLLVLAGAGSGKTRVITRRIAHLVLERGVAPYRILAVTFTNKAAREMRERLEKLLGPAASQLNVSTFHASSAMMLRREADAVGLNRNFLIYDDGDQVSLARRAIKEVGIDVSSMTPREILSKIDSEKNQGRLPGMMKTEGDTKKETFQKIYFRYQELLRASNAVDFGDLLLLVVELLRTNENVRAYYQRRFQHVMVDEFQDTNPVQYEFLKLLAPPPHSNVVVVGDDDQSIYRWRGADVDNILEFPNVYTGSKVVKLEQNYRSDQIILEAANAVISQNPKRMAKKLWSARARGEDLCLIIGKDERGEAQEIAAKIHALRRDGVCDYENMAVFFRTNALSRVVEETFRLMRVPHVLVSGRSFYERAEIKDAASYLRLMVNPHSDADFERVVNVPGRGIGETTVDRVRQYARGAGISLYDAIDVPERIPGLNNSSSKRLASFRTLVDKLKAYAKHTPDATSATKYMLEQSGLISTYLAQGGEDALDRAENLREFANAASEFDKQREERLSAAGIPLAPAVPFPEEATPVGEAEIKAEVVVAPKISKRNRKQNKNQVDLFAQFEEQVPAATASPEPETLASEIKEAEAKAVEIVATKDLGDDVPLEIEAPPLQAFLEQISLVGDADGKTGTGEGRVSLMTMHAAKGLEFDAVFVMAMEEDLFPHRRATDPNSDPGEMAEERRLCYVGFTRARRRLHCSLAQSRAMYGELKFNRPSRFLSEVPPELFGMQEVPEVSRSVEPTLRPRRGRYQDDDSGPSVDSNFDQTSEFEMASNVRGLRVRHEQFGRGTVTESSGSGAGTKYVVRFDNFGTKTVVAKFLQKA